MLMLKADNQPQCEYILHKYCGWFSVPGYCYFYCKAKVCKEIDATGLCHSDHTCHCHCCPNNN